MNRDKPNHDVSENVISITEAENLSRNGRKRKHRLEKDNGLIVAGSKTGSSITVRSSVFSPPIVDMKTGRSLLSDSEESELTEVEDDALSYSTRALVYSVYEDVWKDFYEWEQQYCYKTLQSFYLEAAIVEEAQDEHNSSVYLNTIDFRFEQQYLSRDMDPIHVVEYYNGSCTEYQENSTQITAPFLEPTSSYESCSPTNRSIFVGDDSDELPFIPFPDDPYFKVFEYCDQYNSLSWDKAYNSDRK